MSYELWISQVVYRMRRRHQRCHLYEFRAEVEPDTAISPYMSLGRDPSAESLSLRILDAIWEQKNFLVYLGLIDGGNKAWVVHRVNAKKQSF